MSLICRFVYKQMSIRHKKTELEEGMVFSGAFCRLSGDPSSDNWLVYRSQKWMQNLIAKMPWTKELSQSSHRADSSDRGDFVRVLGEEFSQCFEVKIALKHFSNHNLHKFTINHTNLNKFKTWLG